MSARKLGRLAGLVFVLAAILGGVSAQQHHDGAQPAAVQATTQVTDWG
ncbi:hypothetical protein HH310_35940 [Actinoplanes sp. TBRC 11911]|nr:hypothetical protein [Actinoplanes sp. TBRC 11911]NMO56556.1 hypothetical protein [Actinoplanes sp. TBRC 11911]